MYIRTAPGITIRDPDLLDFIPEEGREVPDSDFWQRRLRDGDVVRSVAVAADPTRTEQ